MLKAYKYRLYPTKSQQVKINLSIGPYRFEFNLAIGTKIRAWQSGQINLTSFDLINHLSELKKGPWLEEVDSQALQASVKKMDAIFRNFHLGQASQNSKYYGHPLRKCNFTAKAISN